MNKEEANILFEKLKHNTNPMYPFFVFKSHLDKDYPEDIGIINLLNEDKMKLFTVDEKMKYIFTNTKPSTITEELKVPFEDLVYSVAFLTKKEVMVIGITVQLFSMRALANLAKKAGIEKPILKNFDIDEKRVGVMFKFIDAKEKTKIFSDSILISLKTGEFIDKIPIKGVEPIIRKDVRIAVYEFVMNSLLFLNEPRVVTYIVSSNNRRRERRGLIPIPSQLITKITPELREYINVNYESHARFGYAFDVRGHWRVLKHPKYGENVGKKLWIAPFIKGEGMKPPQIFSICEK